MSRGRDTLVASFTGVTGTGKSYLAKQNAIAISRAAVRHKLTDKEVFRKGGKVLVLSQTGSGDSWSECLNLKPNQEGFANFKRGWRLVKMAVYDDSKEIDVFQNIFKYFKNGVIILDDCSQYLSANWTNNKGLKNILTEHRHRGYDVFFIGHQPQHIPKQVWSFIAHAFIFRCSSQLKEKDMASEAAPDIVKLQKKVNQEYRVKYIEAGQKKPRGVYKYLKI